MSRFLRGITKSKYHLGIVAIYSMVIIYLAPSVRTYYGFPGKGFVETIIITIFAFASFFLFNKFFQYRKVVYTKYDLKKLLVLIFYAGVLISFPEEIIFRGLIQGGIQHIADNTFISIVIASAIFGLAHFLNGAKSFYPSDWNWKLILLTFIAGIYLGSIYFLTGTLVFPAIVHTLFIIAMKIFLDP